MIRFLMDNQAAIIAMTNHISNYWQGIKTKLTQSDDCQ